MHILVHTYIHTFIHTCTHTHTYIHTYLYTHTYIHSYIHAHTHTYIHRYMHACMHEATESLSPHVSLKHISAYLATAATDRDPVEAKKKENESGASPCISPHQHSPPSWQRLMVMGQMSGVHCFSLPLCVFLFCGSIFFASDYCSLHGYLSTFKLFPPYGREIAYESPKDHN